MTVIVLNSAMDEVSARRLRLLEQVTVDAREDPTGRVFAVAEHADKRTLLQDVNAMIDDGLLVGAKMLNVPSSVGPTAEGARIVSEAQRLRGEARQRRQYTRSAVAEWLLEQPDADELWALNDFIGSNAATFYGQPLTDPEIRDATKWLRDHGYVDGAAAMGYGLVKLKLTTNGIDWVERDGADAVLPQQVSNVSVNAQDSNVVVGGTNVQQSIGVTPELAAELLEQAAAIRQAQPTFGLSPEQAEQLQQLLNDFEDSVAAKKPTAAKVKKLGKRLGKFLTKNVGSALATALGGYLLAKTQGM